MPAESIEDLKACQCLQLEELEVLEVGVGVDSYILYLPILVFSQFIQNASPARSRMELSNSKFLLSLGHPDQST